MNRNSGAMSCVCCLQRGLRSGHRNKMPHSPLPGDLWRPVASEARAACRNGLHKIKTLHKFDKILIKLIFSLFLFPSFTYYKTEKAVWSALFTGSTFVYKARIRSKENSEKSQQDWIFSPFIFLMYNIKSTPPSSGLWIRFFFSIVLKYFTCLGFMRMRLM